MRHPTLNALRTFEVAGRRESFTAAAGELHVSQAAVSRQIAELEDTVGRRLFVRVHRGVVLTPAGQALRRRLTQAFTEISEAVDATRRETSRRLVVSAEAAFARCWLAPRLERLMEECAAIDLRVDSCSRADQLCGESDLAVRYLSLHQRTSAKNMEHLINVRGFPVAAPGLLRRCGPATTPEQVSQLPLLHEDDGRCWQQWFYAAGVGSLKIRHQIQMDDRAALLRAAVAGQGVVIANHLIASEEMAAGLLVRLTSIEVHYGGYWLVHVPGGRRSSAERRFGGWLRRTLIDESAPLRMSAFYHGDRPRRKADAASVT